MNENKPNCCDPNCCEVCQEKQEWHEYITERLSSEASEGIKRRLRAPFYLPFYRLLSDFIISQHFIISFTLALNLSIFL